MGTHHCFVRQCNKDKEAKIDKISYNCATAMASYQTKTGFKKKKTEIASNENNKRKCVCVEHAWDCWPHCIVRIEITAR